MEINNLPIYNPAAVVRNTGKEISGNPAQVNQEQNTSRTLSLQTLIRAANGDNRISAESAEAIANGALPPVVAKLPDNIHKVIEETSKLQTDAYDVDDAYIAQLSNAAQEYAQSTTTAPLPAASSQAYNNYAVQSSSNVVDTATTAFGNQVDIKI
jgi:hypothetical protein